MQEMQFELKAKCDTCPKEIAANLDNAGEYDLFTFRMASHLLQFNYHKWLVEIVLPPKHDITNQSI